MYNNSITGVSFEGQKEADTVKHPYRVYSGRYSDIYSFGGRRILFSFS